MCSAIVIAAPERAAIWSGVNCTWPVRPYLPPSVRAPPPPFGSDGLPFITYYDAQHGSLQAEKCQNISCSSYLGVGTLDASPLAGQYVSVAVGVDGLPIISYYDGTNKDLKVAHCGNVYCSFPIVSTLDTVGDVGTYSSIAIGSDGLPIISYYDATLGDLRVARCDSVTCPTKTARMPDTSGTVGAQTSIAIDRQGLPVISYRDASGSSIKVLRCSDWSCSTSASTTITSVSYLAGDGPFTSITIGTDGLPIIFYLKTTTTQVAALHCSNGFCTPYVRVR